MINLTVHDLHVGQHVMVTDLGMYAVHKETSFPFEAKVTTIHGEGHVWVESLASHESYEIYEPNIDLCKQEDIVLRCVAASEYNFECENPGMERAQIRKAYLNEDKTKWIEWARRWPEVLTLIYKLNNDRLVCIELYPKSVYHFNQLVKSIDDLYLI